MSPSRVCVCSYCFLRSAAVCAALLDGHGEMEGLHARKKDKKQNNGKWNLAQTSQYYYYYYYVSSGFSTVFTHTGNLV